jgi:hypothetical protein
VIVKFNSDGSVDSIIRLHNPPAGRLHPRLFGVFPDGQLLLTGIVDAGNGLGRIPFIGVFDSYGNFEENVILPNAVVPSTPAKTKRNAPDAGRPKVGGLKKKGRMPRKKTRPKIPMGTYQLALGEGRILGGPTDNLYLLQPGNPLALYVVSPGGQVVRAVEIHSPRPGLGLASFEPAGRDYFFATFFGFGRLSIRKQGLHGSLLLVPALIDAASGKVTATFHASRKISRLRPACAEGPNAFEFVGGTKNHKLKVVLFYGG